MTTVSAIHRCLAAAACRGATTIDDQRVGAPTENPDTLCPPCATHISSAIKQLPRDWAELRDTLGERSAANQMKIRSTPSPAMPISARKEALMVAIVETADRAAAVVAVALNTDQPTARRHTPQIAVDGKPTTPLPGTPAFNAAEAVTPAAQQLLRAAIAIIEPSIDLLAAAPAEVFAVWDKFGEDNNQPLIRDTETGEAVSGRGRLYVELTGIQVALRLEKLHHEARFELGKTRLRRRYPMPCPRCGGRVGRDDGETIITCDDRENCRSSWTEREYQFLAGLITRERLDMEIAKWLLAEAYARLDDTQRRLDAITDTDAATLELPGAGQIVVEAIRQAIDGHKPPNERTITSDRKATTERQTSEDTWQWGDQPHTYRPPKRKPRPQTKPVEHPIHPGSLTTLIDIDEDAAINGRIACTECNMTHAGDCP